MTIFSITDGDGEEHVCDSRCYNAKGPICDCPCGGVNHGKGVEAAIANTKEQMEKFTKDFEEQIGTAAEVYVVQYARKA